MRDYFEAEMRLLQEAASEFAAAHPEQARMLRLGEGSDRDPYVERLLEGMAFLTSHVRSRIDESRAVISEQLLARLCPAQVRPYPSATVLELRPQSWRQAAQSVPSGAVVFSRPVGEAAVRCPFTLTRGLRLYPLEVHALTAQESDTGETRLSIELRAHGTTPIAGLGLGHLDFFISADRALGTSLYALLTGALQIHARADQGPLRAAPALRFRPVGLEDEGGLLPAGESGQLGLDLLQDYFCFRERYFFLRLEGLDDPSLGEAEQRLSLEVTAPIRLPPGHRLGAEHLRLFCVPAVNLWPMDAEPITLDHRRSEYRLDADASRPDAVSIQAVESVTTRSRRSGEVSELRPLHRLHPGQRARYFHATRHSHGSDSAHTYLQLGGGEATETETLSARVLACNGHLPRRHLGEGDVCEPGADFPSDLRVRNLGRPSPCYPPPAPLEHPLRLHGFLAASVGSLADAPTLRRLLHLMDWSERPENRQRINALSAIRARPLHCLRHGLLQRGLCLEAEVEEGAFLSLADMRLFGDVLHAYLAGAAAVNEFVSLSITTQPRHRELKWPPRTGQSSPL